MEVKKKERGSGMHIVNGSENVPGGYKYLLVVGVPSKHIPGPGVYLPEHGGHVFLLGQEN